MMSVAKYSEMPNETAMAAVRAAFTPITGVARAWLDATDPGWAAGEDLALARVLWATAHGHITIELAGHAEPALTDDLVARSLRAVIAGWGDTTR